MAAIRCRWILLQSAFVWCSQAVFNRPNEIKLENNEYTDVLVAIHKDVPEDQQIVDRLKEIFIEASQDLYVATNNRTFFKEVKILIPNTWTKKPEYLPAGTKTFERANVRVDRPNPLYVDNPYVQQKGGCGEPGDYMHLTPKYVLDKEYGEELWGPHGKTLVHEWGHLRWGLFDEYGFDDPLGGSYPHFYASTTSMPAIQPVRCSAYTAGSPMHAVTLNRCDLDRETGLPEANCRFVPDFRGNRATGSYMFMQFLPQVTGFCHSDPEGDPLSYHNREAPNKQNVMCNGQSAWDVMNKHQDFDSGANPPRSGERIRLLNQVATRFIRNTVSLGTSVGVVTFSSTASIRHPVVSVNSEAVRNDLIAAVPTSTGGGTCIGCGLRKGIEALETTGPPHGSVILLLTDGGDSRPYVSEVLPDLLTKEIIVDTVAISQNADDRLESLAEGTGGLSFFSGNGDSIALDNAFTATFEENAESKGVNLLSEEQTISGRQTYANHLYVDNSVGENTTFSFSWLDGSRPTVMMVTPLGLVITEGHSMYDVTSDTITIAIPATATPGKWTYNITNNGPGNQDITIIATSNPVNNNEPITVTAQVSTVSLDYSSSRPTALKMFASVRKGYLPVLGAAVKVLIKKPDGQVEEITLLDNGAGADVTKNDGIYSRYFYNFTADGRYGVSVRADNTQGRAEYIVINNTRGTGALPMDPGTAYVNGSNVQREPLEQFQRMTTGGVFEVRGVPSGGANTDMLPPSRVDDLKVVEVSYGNSTVTLSWTAQGDDFDQGGPARYVEIRYGRHFEQLLDNFTSSASVNHSQVLQGSLTSPPEPGSAQTIVILVPDRGDNVTFVFAVRTCDEADNCGDRSNIVSANLEYIDVPSPEPMTVNDTTPLTNSTELVTVNYTTPLATSAEPVKVIDATRLATIVGSVVGSILALVIVALALCYCKRSRSAKYSLSASGRVNPTYAV
ncbi:calcium-activated chloride channel regulator 1-like [Branchiostoma floridae]|uniref:Calcium-activated chloride channel regulator 1-like n=1 Tax=Branchiostoma floridae TaxID=7739 RepID=A0A9J7HUB5_BRAFL|nr:calcium-activated chloride channel regulator 1-like [Branchiostoma floridae]